MLQNVFICARAGFIYSTLPIPFPNFVVRGGGVDLSLCWLNFFVQSLFFQALWKTQIFISQFFSIHRSQPRFGVGWPKTTIKRLGTTICGSQPRISGWEPHIVVPNLLIVLLGQPTPNLGWDLGTEKNWDKKICVFQSAWKKRDSTKKFSQHRLTCKFSLG